MTTTASSPPGNRRQFLRESSAVVGITLASGLAAPAVHAAEDNTLRLGLIGCGGRGTGAAQQALTADPNTKLVAMGDAFRDRAEGSRASLLKSSVADRVAVDDDHIFDGFEAYKQVIAADVDVVLLACTPHFRPKHLRACIEAGKHVFAEKPVAVDAPGVRSVLETCRLAKEKRLSVVSGLCWRYETNTLDMMARLHDGAIGDVTTLATTRYGGGVWVRPRVEGMTEMQYQMRNWYYFTWLGGDFIVEQFVHELDRMAWLMQGEYPVSCISTGGRQTRTGPDHGHVYDHFACQFQYASGAKLFATTRHQPGCSGKFTVEAIGTQGTCDLQKFEIAGANPWSSGQRRTAMHQLEHDAMYAALRRGEVINNGEYMAKSTMMAIIGRMSAYTGKELSWEQAMNSEQRLAPASYDWDAAPPPAEIAMPGVTKFV